MNDAKKQSRWVKTLDQAGLLDEIEDGWTLSGDVSDPDASIRVDGSGGKTIPPPNDIPESRREDWPITRKQGERDIAIVDDVQRTPVERRKSSDPAADPQKSRSKPRIEVTSARSTQSGIPRPSYIPAPPIEAPEPQLEGEVIRERERVVVAKARISVVPGDDWSKRFEALSPIVDEPPTDGDGVRLRPSRAPKVSMDARRSKMAERMELGDFTGALEAAEEMLLASSDDIEAIKVRDECRSVLIGMYEARIGNFERIPEVIISPHELIWRNLDASTGFVVSRIDGASSIEDILDISGLPRFETCRILAQLLQDGIIR